MAKIKKAQDGKKVKPALVKATPDSSKYYKDEKDFQWKLAKTAAEYGMRESAEESRKKAMKASEDEFRQKFKGKPGFDKNGFPLKQKSGGKTKKVMKSGGKMKSYSKPVSRTAKKKK